MDCPDGRDYDIYDYPFTDSDGSAMIMEMGIDITEVHKAQVALEEVNRTLEQRVAERTSKLANANKRLQDEIEQRRKAEVALLQAKEDWESAHSTPCRSYCSAGRPAPHCARQPSYGGIRGSGSGTMHRSAMLRVCAWHRWAS